MICGSPHVVFTFNRLRRVVKPTVYIPISRNVYPIFTRYKIVRFARPHHVYNNITADAYIPEVGDCLFVFPELSVLCVCVYVCMGGGGVDRSIGAESETETAAMYFVSDLYCTLYTKYIYGTPPKQRAVVKCLRRAKHSIYIYIKGVVGGGGAAVGGVKNTYARVSLRAGFAINT